MTNANETRKNIALYNENVESSVLGGIAAWLNNGKSTLLYAVDADDFCLPSHRMIYLAMRSLNDIKEPVDILTLNAEVKRLYPKASGDDYAAVVKTITDGMRYINAERYVEMLKEASLRRKLTTIADEMATAACDQGEDVSVLLDNIRAKLRDVVQTKSAWSSMTDVMTATFDYIEKLQSGEIVAIKSGVRNVDRATGGFFPGELAVVGARPAVGKSAFGLQIAVSAATSGHKVCFVSCEMVDSQFGQRLITNSAKIDGMKLRNATLEKEDWCAIVDAMERYSHLPINFTFGSKTIEDLRNDVQRKVDMGECDFVVVDYLQLLRTKRRFDIEHERIGYISHALKQMTTDFKIPVVALAQAKRQNNNGRARCPVLDDLRASGDIEQDADTVIFLHRPDDAGDPTVAEKESGCFEELQEKGMQYIVFSVAKQRQGQTGIISAAFDPAHMRYLPIEEA